MSGYLQYSNYGDEDETPTKRKIQPMQSTQPTQPTQSGQSGQPKKRILRTLRSRAGQQSQQPQQQQPQGTLNPNQQLGLGNQGTLNQQPGQHKYVQELIQKIHSYEDGASASDAEEDNDGDNNYATHAQAIQQHFRTEPVSNRDRFAGATGADLTAKLNPAPNKEAFTSNANALAQKLYVPSMFDGSVGENKDILLEKLDHIISLLEDQQDEKTGHVSEELVLYCFLGVFIIFIVDSFARAGKYVR
jgi:hypothetical protein